MLAVCSGTGGIGCCGWSDMAKPPEITPPTPLSTLRLTHSPTVSGYFWDSLKALSALMLPLPSVPALGPLHKAEEHRIGLHFRGPERTSEGQASQRPHA